MNRKIDVARKTKETDIKLTLDLEGKRGAKLNTGLPFFEHMLNAMAFHGGFSLAIEAKGDIEVDPHHLVEDIGLVLGQAFGELRERAPLARYGHSIIPMDEALSEVTIDSSGRPYLIFLGKFPQSHAGDFDLSLIREFLLALANKGGMNIHAECRYGENGHHMAEALFKALGRALSQSNTLIGSENTLSTKGSL